MIGYIYLTPPLSQSSFFARVELLKSVPPNLQMYFQRFLLSFFLLGVFPLISAVACGFKLRDLGLRLKPKSFRTRWIGVLMIAGIVLGAVSSRFSDLAGYYPYYPNLDIAVEANGAVVLLLHSAAYFIFFYLPWEVLFRGILIFTIIKGIEDDAPYSALLLIACFQIIPSTLLHFGHPLSETLSAVLLGLIAGYVTLRSRSIIPVLVFHSALGISLDIFLSLPL